MICFFSSLMTRVVYPFSILRIRVWSIGTAHLFVVCASISPVLYSIHASAISINGLIAWRKVTDSTGIDQFFVPQMYVEQHCSVSPRSLYLDLSVSAHGNALEPGLDQLRPERKFTVCAITTIMGVHAP